jgi:hypothetical protein
VVHNASALGDSACPDVSTEGRAARVLAAPRGRFTLIALGPLTNVAQALARDRSLAGRIERVFIMGGSTTHGNLCCGAGDGIDHGQEFNFWADPAAAQKVFSALSGKLHLIALNATDFVPITFDFADRLATDNTTVATATVVTILSDPDVREFMRQGLMYWWDPLAAATAITGRFVTYERTRLSVVQSGVEAGRTVVDRRGARVRLAVAADAQAFEDHFLAMLNGHARRDPGGVAEQVHRRRGGTLQSGRTATSDDRQLDVVGGRSGLSDTEDAVFHGGIMDPLPIERSGGGVRLARE